MTDQAHVCVRYFFSAAGSAIKVHSTTTGEIVSTLSPPISSNAEKSQFGARGHSEAITCIILNPDNPFQLITGSLDGTIKLWDFMDGVLLQTIDLAQPIHYLCAHTAFKGYLFVAGGHQTKRSGHTFIVNLLFLF
jgi:NET1-associated nuclear protein 1 (U3 small nucleolar RNA-associated protein 17)